MCDPTRDVTDSQLRNWVRGERSTPPDREKVAEWLAALDEVRARERAVRPVLDAADGLASAAAGLLDHCAYVNRMRMAENVVQTWRIDRDLAEPLAAYQAAVGGSAEVTGEVDHAHNSANEGPAEADEPEPAPLPPHPRIWWDGRDFLALVPGPLLGAPDDDGQVRSTMPGLYRARTEQDVTASEGPVVELRALAEAGAPAQPEVPTCGEVYNGRFWSGAPCRHGRGHEGRHADVYGRTWTNEADDHEDDDELGECHDPDCPEGHGAALAASAPQPPEADS